jgi:hypothetical protein
MQIAVKRICFYLATMKSFLSITLLCIVLHASGQFIPVNVKLDASIGTHFMHSQLSEGAKIEKVIPHSFLGGLSYLLKDNLYVRGELGLNLNRAAVGSIYFRNDYFRSTVGVSADLFKLKFKQTQGQRNAVRLWQDQFKLFGFVGLGMSAMINNMKFPDDYDKKIYVYDYMANFCASITPTYQINRFNAVFVKATMIGHIRQANNFDMLIYQDNLGFDGGFMTFQVGYSFTPFKSMAGTRTVN